MAGTGAVGVHGEEAGEELVVVAGEATGDDFRGLGEGDDALFEVDGDVNVRGRRGSRRRRTRCRSRTPARFPWCPCRGWRWSVSTFFWTKALAGLWLRLRSRNPSRRMTLRTRVTFPLPPYPAMRRSRFSRFAGPCRWGLSCLSCCG